MIKCDLASGIYVWLALSVGGRTASDLSPNLYWAGYKNGWYAIRKFTCLPEAGLGDLASALSLLYVLGEIPSPFSASFSFSVS